MGSLPFSWFGIYPWSVCWCSRFNHWDEFIGYATLFAGLIDIIFFFCYPLSQSFGSRLMVGLQVLVLAIGVRVPTPEQWFKNRKNQLYLADFLVHFMLYYMS